MRIFYCLRCTLHASSKSLLLYLLTSPPNFLSAMRTLFRRLALVLTSIAMAAWLRMLDPTLSWQSWSNLIGKPLKLWIGSALVMPLVELFYYWPFYLFAGLIYFVVFTLAFALEDKKPSLVPSVLLGAVVGAAGYSIAMAATEWLMRPPAHNLKLLLIYAVTGAFFGRLCFLFETSHVQKAEPVS